MARNLAELEKQLAMLESKHQEQALQIRKKSEDLLELLRPVNVLKRAASDLLSGTGAKSALFSGIAGMAGSFLIDGLVLKKSSFIKKLAGRLFTNKIVEDLLQGEDSGIRHWILKIKDLVVGDEKEEHGEKKQEK